MIMHPVQQQPPEEDSPQEKEARIVRLTLYPSQAKQFSPLLADAFERTGGIHGALFTCNRCQDLSEGHLLLELQAAVLDGTRTRRIQQLILESRQESE
jgi:hypothetical protein